MAAWLRHEPVRIAGAHVQEVLRAGDEDVRVSHRDRIFELVEQYRRLTGRHLVTDADLHAFLLGAIGVAGATRLPLSDVVARSVPSGARADETAEFARTVDTAHEAAHRIRDAAARRTWLLGQLDGICTADFFYRAELQRKLFAYLECELGRKRAVAR